MSWWDSFLWWLGFSICHQQQGRILNYGDRLLFICARDTGLFIGLFTAGAALLMFSRKTRKPPKAVYLLTLAGFVFFLWDSVTSYLGTRESTNILRLLSGFFCGAGLALPLVFGVAVNLFGIGRRERRHRDLGAVWKYLAGSSVALLPYVWRPPALFRLAQVYLFLSVAGTLIFLNLVFLLSFDSLNRWALQDSEAGGSVVSRYGMRFVFLAMAALGMVTLELFAGHLAHHLVSGG